MALGKKGFKDLIVWQRARDLTIFIYKMTEQGKIAKDYYLKDQIRRSAVSIASNIAEGDERNTDNEAVRFFYFAKGSLAELLTQMDIAFCVGLIQEDQFVKVESDCMAIGKMLWRLIEARSKSP